MSSRNKRIYGLDYMRGLACILVVLYHYTTRLVELFPDLEPNWYFKVPFGYMGVCVFFLLSGYLALNQYKDDITVWKYVKGKIKRLYPCYWCAVVLTFCTTKLFLSERSVSLKAFFFNLTMLESFLGVDPVDGAYWTLANELIFYFFIAVFFVLLKQHSKFTWVAIVWLCITNVILYFENDSIFFALANKLFMAQYAHMFLAGGLVCTLFLSDRLYEYMMNLIGVVFCIVTQFRVFSIGYGLFFLTSILMLVFILIMDKKNIAFFQKRIVMLRPLIYIASISYPLYLIHQNIGYSLIINIHRAGFEDEAVILLPMILLTLLAYVMHMCIEIPMSKK